jgi:transposase-like protein
VLSEETDLRRAVDHEGEVLESYVTKRRDRKAALKFIRRSMKHCRKPEVIVTDKLLSYGADVSRRCLRGWRQRINPVSVY